MKTSLSHFHCRCNLLPTLLLAAHLLFLPTPLHAQNYQATELGTLGGTTSYANGINASGTVVGVASTPGDEMNHATRFGGNGANSGNVDLDPSHTDSSAATAINAAGVIVGYSPNTDFGVHATRFSGTGTGNFDLGNLGGFGGFAQAINASGVVVGESQKGAYIATRFSGTGTGNTELGTLGGDLSTAHAINASGVIVGEADTMDNAATHATLFSGTGTGNTDLGTLGGPLSSANAVNDAGVIVGNANPLNSVLDLATRFSGTGTGNISLGTLGGNESAANAINNSGVIVGTSVTSGAVNHAFVYRNGTMIDLNSLIPAGSGVVLTDARGINDAGQIAAIGTVKGDYRAFRLDPVSVPPVASYKITVSASPSAKGTVTGGGTFKKGKSVTVTASPKKGKSFVKWSENGKQVSLNKRYTFTVTKARSLVANFK